MNLLALGLTLSFFALIILIIVAYEDESPLFLGVCVLVLITVVGATFALGEQSTELIKLEEEVAVLREHSTIPVDLECPRCGNIMTSGEESVWECEKCAENREPSTRSKSD